MKTRDERRRHGGPARAKLAGLALLCLTAQAGCGREFFREWANQDASEAIFEKSRDPRWRLDQFSIEPPALSRFASPYDPDQPPAPPDDRASQAMAPVPQWPDNRLIVPAEGTGYLDMLAQWQSRRPAGNTRRVGTPGLDGPKPTGAPGAGADAPPGPPAADTASPFRPTNPAAAPGPPGSPIPLPDDPTPAVPTPATPPLIPTPDPAPRPDDATPPAPLPAAELTPVPALPTPGTPAPALDAPAPGTAAPATGPQSQAKPWTVDPGVKLSAFQQSGLPLPVPSTAAPTQPPGTAPRPLDPDHDEPVPNTRSATPGLPTPSIGMDPNPSNRDLSAPDNPRPDLPPGQYRATEGVTAELSSILVPGVIDFNEAEAAGLKRDSQPYIITMEQAFTLTLINSRAYQFNLENLYLNSLQVALQRFAFTPQFYAGLSPTTGVAQLGPAGPGGGILSPNPPNSFIYQTAETGQQVSALNLGTAVGVGKVFQSGARILAGFATQIVFNFAGRNSSQPSVRGYLPLTIVQPFLRGGGRAVTLELLTQAERNLLYSIRSFAKFRQEFVVATLSGGSPVTNLGAAVQTPGFSGGGNNDPTIGFINILEDVQIVQNNRRNIAAYEQFKSVYTELIKGESSGLTRLQLDQVDQQLQNARSNLVQTRTLYRFDLDRFKVQMGLPPDTPLVCDRRLTNKFREVFDAVDEWQRDPNRELDQLPRFAAALPALEDVIIDGRSILGVYKDEKDAEDKLEDVLLAAERTALEHRLELMNARAQLYDAWRQIKVQANALQGVLNIALSNQFITPPLTTNPFAFVDQAKQFSLVINAELPLVRINERNNFRAALIGYERQRRSLQSTEDTVKLSMREDTRNYLQFYLQYEIAKRNFVLLIAQKDQAFEQIIAPPQGTAGSTQGAVQTNNLISAQTQLIQTENNLVSLWYNFQSARLALYRDLGTLPYDEWEAFHELFPDEPISPGADAAARGAGASRAAAAAEPGSNARPVEAEAPPRR